MKKKIFLGASSLALAGLLFTASPSEAFWPFDGLMKSNNGQAQTTQSGFPPLIQKIIEKFNLNKDEVKKVMEETRQENQNQRQAQFEEKLGQAVAQGKITEEQKNLILAKHQEMRKNMEEWQKLSPEERRNKSREQYEEMKKWAEENNIDLDWMMGWGRGFKQGFKASRMLGHPRVEMKNFPH